MENSFYIGIVHHSIKFFDGKNFFRSEYNESLVLYHLGGSNYLDLVTGNFYNTDSNAKDYVFEDSLVITDVGDYKINYMYLLERYKEDIAVKKKKI